MHFAACLVLTVAASPRSEAGDGELVEVRILFQDARLVLEEGETAAVYVDTGTRRTTEARWRTRSDESLLVLVPPSQLEVRKLATGLFQVAAKGSDRPFWRIHARCDAVRLVDFGIFGTDGGEEDRQGQLELLPASQEEKLAGNLQVRIRDLELVLRPEGNRLLLEGGGLPLGGEKTWEVEQLGPFRFHARNRDGWAEQYLAVDAGGVEVGLVRPGQTFGAAGEDSRTLSAEVQPIRLGGRYDSGTDVPRLLDPPAGAELDNGCRVHKDPLDTMLWRFRWTPVDGAERYEIGVGLNDYQIYESRHPFLVVEEQAWVSNRNRNGWRWRVRALREGKALPWSAARKFRVEEVDTDVAPADFLIDAEPQTKGAKSTRGQRKPGKSPTLVRPEAGAVLDNGRADGRDSLEWTFEWKPIRGCKEYELILVRGLEGYPFLRERVRGTRFVLQTDDYRLFGPRRQNWIWRVRVTRRGKPGPWSEKRTFTLEPLDTDPPRLPGDQGGPVGTPDIPVLLAPESGAALENARPQGQGEHQYSWIFRWQAVPSAQAYEIEYGQRGHGLSPRRGRVDSTTFETTGTAYWFRALDWYWRVRAIRDGKPLPWSLKRPFDLREPDR